MIQHWDTFDDALSASKKMFNNPMTETFVKAIVPISVKMVKLAQIGEWKISKGD
jgi:hypothetical protein